MKTFEIETNCNGGGKPHKHKIVVEARGEEAFGASKPERMRMQYTCPVTGEKLVVTFIPPVGAPRPFEIEKVN